MGRKMRISKLLMPNEKINDPSIILMVEGRGGMQDED